MLCHEYGWSLEYALGVSLARAHMLYAARAATYGAKETGPSYEEQEMLAELEQARTSSGTEEPTWGS